MGPTRRIMERFLAGERLSVPQIKREENCTGPVLFHARKALELRGHRFDHQWVPATTEQPGHNRYWIVAPAEAPAPTIEDRIARIERILRVHRLGDSADFDFPDFTF